MEVQSPSFQPSASQAQFVPPMFMPYIEGPKMDWTVNDGLYHRFLKWKLKYENILDCELAMIPESKKCKKVIAWSGDLGMDQYVSRSLPAEDLCLDVLWSKVENFCKPHANEVRARFNLLTSFRQENRSVDEWYNVVQVKFHLLNTHQRLQVSCTETCFGFSCEMKILFPTQSMNAVLILTSFLQAKSGSLQRKWRHQRLQCITSNKLQVTLKQPKSIWWDISRQTSHQARARRNRILSSQNHPVTRGIQVKAINKCHPRKRNLILIKHIPEKIDVPSVEIQSM